MPRTDHAPRRSARPTTAVLGAVTVLAFAVAVAARVVVDRLVAGLEARPARLGALRGDEPVFRTLDMAASVGAAAAGAGVLLFGATLVVVVLRHRDRRITGLLAGTTLVLVLGAVAAAAGAATSTDPTLVAGLGILRTALAGLAAASLPALVLAAVRARATSSSPPRRR